MSTKEIAFAKPPDFDGKRSNAQYFWDACQAYLRGNKDIYKTDLHKITFVLSFMKTGSAATFASNKYKTYTDTAEYGTWADFAKAFDAQFLPVNAKQDASFAIANCKQDDDVDGFIATFKSLALQAGFTQEEPLIEYFRRGLKSSIADKIYNRGEPTTLEGWYTEASKAQQNLRRQAELKHARQALVWGFGTSPGNNLTKKTDP